MARLPTTIATVLLLSALTLGGAPCAPATARADQQPATGDPGTSLAELAAQTSSAAASPAGAPDTADGVPTPEARSDVPETPASAPTPQAPAGEVQATTSTAGSGTPSAVQADHQGPSTFATGQAPGLASDKFQVQADRVFVTEKALAAEGHVVVRTDQYTITADRVEVDRRNEIASFRGHVVIEGNHQRTTGTELRVDLDSGWWKMQGAQTRVDPEFFTGNVLEPLYARGRVAEYSPDQDNIVVDHGALTSCDLWRHYEFRSSRITLRPNNRVTFRRPSLYFYGHRLIQYPFNLTYSLKEEEQKIFPEFGSNEVEGRFLKIAALYTLTAHNSGLARLHLTEKRGIGLGFDHVMQDARQRLDLSVFDEPSEGAVSLRTHHTYAYSSTFSHDLSANYQSNSGYLYSTRTLSSNLTFRNVDANSDTTLGLQESTTSSSYGSSNRFGSTFYHNQRSGRTSWSVRDTYSRSRFAGQVAADEELNATFDLRHQARAFDLNMQASKRYDLDASRYAGDAQYYSLDKLPAVEVDTDTTRLGGWRPLGRVHTRLRGDLGYFRQQPDGRSIKRGALTADFGGYDHSLDAHTRYRTGLRFRQSWYDDGSAQYHARFTGDLRHALDGHWHTRLAYDYACTRGFAPLRLDYGGRANEVRLQLVRFAPDSSRLELSSGYDFISDQYRDLRILGELRSSAHSYWRLQSAYSFARSEWWPVLLQYITARDRLFLSTSGRYDISRGKLSSIVADLDWRFHRLWRLEFVGSYSGFTHRLDQADVRLTRDWHCLVAQMTYSKWPRELSFSIGIKAFPAASRTLGIGATGAYLPASPGEFY